jgi:SAM-dependent methyltransferase
MQQRHIDRQQYFNEQSESTRNYILPYIEQGLEKPINKGFRVLEVGCGEGGNLLPFLEKGCECWGVELSDVNYDNALKFYAESPQKSRLHLVHKNIYDVTPDELGGTFDIVFLRDVIEHIPEQEKIIHYLKTFISPNGVIFFAFPPWRMPFGGHQQVSRSKFISRVPWIHIFPKPLYRGILKVLGSSNDEIDCLLEIAETGISIRRFEKIIRSENFQIIRNTYWFINPNYEIKFGLKQRRLHRIFRIPIVQDFYTTAVYYLLKTQ